MRPAPGDPDPLEFIFQCSKAWGMSPEDVLNMDGSIFQKYSSWTLGHAAGEQVRMERM